MALVTAATIFLVNIKKIKKKSLRLYYNTIKISLQGKFGHNNPGFVKTKFWKRKRHLTEQLRSTFI